MMTVDINFYNLSFTAEFNLFVQLSKTLFNKAPGSFHNINVKRK